MKFKSCITLMLLVSGINVRSQVPAIDTLRIDTTRMTSPLSRVTLLYKDASHNITPGQLAELHFTDTLPLQFKVFPELVQKDIYLKFVLANRGDSIINFSFFPGMYFGSIQLFRQGHTNDVEEITNHPGEIYGFKKLLLGAHETATYFAKLKFIKTTTHTFSPVLIRDYYRSSFIAKYQSFDKSGNIMTFLFSGVLLMMIFYSLAVYVLNRNAEFLYYSAYAFCLGLMLFLKSYFFRVPSEFNNFFEAYLDFVMQSVGTFIYLAFLRKFIDTRNNYPWLHKLMIIEQITIFISLLLYSFLFFYTENYVLQNAVESYSKYIWVIGTVVFVIYTLNKKNKLLNYLAVGHSFLILGGFVSLYLITSPSTAEFRINHPGPIGNALTYYELGLAIELMFFLTALAFKNKSDIEGRTKERERLKLKTERQDLEKQLAVISAQQDERNRISADMHDELGSGVTAIRLMSEILKEKTKDKVYPELDKISNNANELIIKMNTLIWTMKSDNDSVESLITYIRIYSLEFFENTAMNCIVKMPPSIPNIELIGSKRRNLFLSVKETLNNVLKHSKADEVIISFQINDKLLISITDNGVGIDQNNLRRFGSGLTNIKKRLEGIEGRYKIENRADGGVKTTFELIL